MNKMQGSQLTWNWLGGFFQAEGCLSGRQLTFTQKEREPLDLIRDFLASRFPNLRIPRVYKYLSSQKSFKPGNPLHLLPVHIGKAQECIVHMLAPHLHGEKRHKCLGETLSTLYEQIPIDDEWIAGFWEGDGSIWSSNMLQFHQKDRTLLNEVQNYLGYGSIKPRSDHPDCYTLSISIGMSNVDRIGELLSHVRTQPRLEQLDRVK